MLRMKFLKLLIPLCDFIMMVTMVSLVVVLATSEEIDNFPLVNTTVGVIRGLRADDGSAMFLGIPYAVVDEKNPFGTAIVSPKLEGVFNAFSDSARCPQLRDLPTTSLDCLHLHVHVPENTKKDPLPVLVYFYGGEFLYGMSGRNECGPKYLMRHNIIFVSFNYRLSAYGFMCLHTPEIPGNQGLKDQINALRWIKKNIKAFGGDDENITIVGNSAGAASVDLQLLFADEGLFHKVISLSGPSLAPWCFPDPDLKAAFKIASKLGLQTNNVSEAITFLSHHTPSQVLLATANLAITFAPCVEKKISNVEQFVVSHPVSTPFAKARNVRIIYGYNNDEMLPLYFNTSAQEIVTLDVINIHMNLGLKIRHNDVMKSLVRRFYTADEVLSANVKQDIIDFASDFRIAHPVQRTLAKYLEHGGIAYHYVFSYVGGRNLESIKYNVTKGGAGHADDVGYFLDVSTINEIPTPDDQLMIDRITTLFTNFAKHG